MSSYELIIAQLLTKEKYRFQQEKTFSDLRGGRYRFDFYLPNVNGGTIIEIDGEQHWQPIHGRLELKKTQQHDRAKNSYCLAHDIPLYRIPWWKINEMKSFEDLRRDEFRVRSKYHNDNLQPPK